MPLASRLASSSVNPFSTSLAIVAVSDSAMSCSFSSYVLLLLLDWLSTPPGDYCVANRRVHFGYLGFALLLGFLELIFQGFDFVVGFLYCFVVHGLDVFQVLAPAAHLLV